MKTKYLVFVCLLLTGLFAGKITAQTTTTGNTQTIVYDSFQKRAVTRLMIIIQSGRTASDPVRWRLTIRALLPTESFLSVPCRFRQAMIYTC